MPMFLAMMGAQAARASVTVTVSPTSISLTTGSQKTFTATVTGSTNTGVTWSVSSGGGSITTAGVYTASSTAGTYTVTATSKANTTKKATATVTVTAVKVTLSPTTATVAQGATQAFTATVTGSANTAVTWSVTSPATINSSGLFTAPATAGSYTVTATSQADTSKKATATVTVPAVAVSMTPTSVTLGAGGTQTFTATVTGSTNTGVTWSVSSGGGSITTAGVYTASSTAGTYTVTATSKADTTKKATATVTVAVITVSVSPATATLSTGGTQTFTATVTGTSNTAVTWSAPSGGTITTAGKFTAPGTAGTYTVRATSNALASAYGQASATVVAAPNATITAPSSVTIQTGGWTASVPAQAGSTCAWTISHGSITAGAGTNAITFSATTGTSLTLTCKVTNAAGTATTGTKTVTLIAAPVISDFSSDAYAIPPGGNTQLHASFTGGTGSIDQGIGAVTSGGSVTISPTANTTYTLTVTNAAGTSTTGTVEVDVVPLPVATITAPPVVTAGLLGCQASVPSQPGCTYFWTITNGTLIAGITGPPGTSSSGGSQITFRPGTAGTALVLQCTVANQVGSLSSPMSISVVPLPQALITTAQVVSANATGLTASVPSVAGCSYLWSIQGGTLTSSAAGANVTFTAPASGSISLLCTVTNAAGTTATGSTGISVTGQAGDLTGVYALPVSRDQPFFELALTQTGNQVVGYSVGNTADESPLPFDAPIRPSLRIGGPLGAVAKQTLIQTVSTPATPSWLTYVTISGTVSNGVLQCTVRNAGVLIGALSGTLSADGMTLTFSSPSRPSVTSSFTRLPGAIAVISPQSEILIAAGGQFQFTPSVIGTANTGLTWEIGGAPGEAVTAAGLYTAPTQPGIYAVTARSVADPARCATTMVQVTPDGSLDAAKAVFGNSLSRCFLDGSTLIADAYNGQGNGIISYTGVLSGTNWAGTWTEGTSSGAFDTSLAADAPLGVTPSFGMVFSPASATNGVVSTSQVSSDFDWTAFQPVLNQDAWGLNFPVTWSTTSGDLLPTLSGHAIFLPPAKSGVSYLVAQSIAEPSAVMAEPLIHLTPRQTSPIQGVYALTTGELDVYSPTSAAMNTDTGSSNLTGQIVWSGSPFGTLPCQLYQPDPVNTPWLFQGWCVTSQGKEVDLEADFNADFTAFSGTWQISGQAAQTWNGTLEAGQARVKIALPFSSLVNGGAVVPMQASVAGGIDQDVTWSTTGGSISPHGFFTAPMTAGTITVTATSNADPSHSDTHTFTVLDHLLHQNLAATYGGGLYALLQDGNHIWSLAPGTYNLSPPTIPASLLEGDTLYDPSTLSPVLTLASDDSSFTQAGVSGTILRDAQPADAVLLQPFYATTTPGQSVTLKVLATGTPQLSALYGTVTPQGIYTAPSYPVRDTVTAKQGNATFQVRIDVMDVGPVNVAGSFKEFTVRPSPMQLTIAQTPGNSLVQGQIPSDPFGHSISLIGDLKGAVWSGIWMVPGDGVREGSFTGHFGPRGDVLDLWLSPGSGHLGNHYVFNRQVQVQITPTTSLLLPGMSQQFLGTIVGQVSQAITWSSNTGNPSSISQTGVFTAPASVGAYTVTATPTGAPNGPTGTALVQVYTPYPLVMQPSYVSLQPGGTARLQALANGVDIPYPVTWSVTEVGGGSITAAGVYTAPLAPGTYHAVATSTADGTQAGTVTIRVSSPAATISVTVLPGSIALNKSGTATFTAQVIGAANPAVTWSCSAGTINPVSGTYTAPAVFGTYTVTATSAQDGTTIGVATVTVQALAGTDAALSYDANGNLVSDGQRIFEWDAENRLTAATEVATGHRTEFTYDGLGRRVEIAEKDNGNVSNDTKYLWDGQAMAESRATGGATLQRYYQQGFVDTDGTALYYTRDHQGSVRELTDSSQAVRARYDYDPYGRMTQLSGDRTSPFLFTGHFWHGQSGLYLARYREYDPNLGRWISRDPAGNADGSNEYAYVQNRVVNATDPTGLWTLLNPLSWMDGDHYQGLGTEFFTHDDMVAACASTLDGLNPFGNPFSDLYDPCDTKYKISKALGSVSSLLIGGAFALDAFAPLVVDEMTADMVGADAASESSSLSFSQTTASPYFSAEGDFAGQSINDVATELRAGGLDPADVPVQTVNLGEGDLIVNTRSALSLMQAGIPQSEWAIADMTGDAEVEARIAQRLINNQLTSAGTDVLRITGSGANASTYIP